MFKRFSGTVIFSLKMNRFYTVWKNNLLKVFTIFSETDMST